MSLELIKLKNKEINFLKDENKVLRKRVEELEIKIETAFHDGVKNGNEAMKIVYESRTCENCKFYIKDQCHNEASVCNLANYPFSLNKKFGCNQWELK